MGESEEDAGAVARVCLGSACRAVGHPAERLEAVGHDRVRCGPLHVCDDRNTAAVPLVGGIVEAARARPPHDPSPPASARRERPGAGVSWARRYLTQAATSGESARSRRWTSARGLISVGSSSEVTSTPLATSTWTVRCGRIPDPVRLGDGGLDRVDVVEGALDRRLRVVAPKIRADLPRYPKLRIEADQALPGQVPGLHPPPLREPVPGPEDGHHRLVPERDPRQIRPPVRV